MCSYLVFIHRVVDYVTTSRTLIHYMKHFLSQKHLAFTENIYLLHSVLLNLHVARVMMCWVDGCWFGVSRVELVSTRRTRRRWVRCRGSAAGCWGSEAVGTFRAGSLPGTFLSKTTQQSDCTDTSPMVTSFVSLNQKFALTSR